MRDIAKALGLASGTPVREWLDPAYRRDRQDRENARRAGNHRHAKRPRSKTIEARDAVQLFRAIPKDTRDLTARLCGDPLPGRRALDLRGPGRA